MGDLGLSKVNANMCRFGMTSREEVGIGLVKKPTGLLTHSDVLQDQLSWKCLGGHRHGQLVGGRAKACQVYPVRLVRAICKRIQLELKQNGVLSLVYQDLLNVNCADPDLVGYSGHFIDDMPGQILKKDLVIKARKEEMATYFSHKAYDKVPLSECWDVTDKAPIGCRWIGINKGDDNNPDYRSRHVAKEININPSDEMFATAPPLEAKNMLFSIAMIEFALNRAKRSKGTQKLLFIDVRRAYVDAPSRRSVYDTLPDEDAMPGHCARLNVSLYGTRDAASHLDEKYARHLIRCGFTQGLSSPCVFFHEGRKVSVVVHGDDFTFLGDETALNWCTTITQEAYKVKIRGRLGPDKHDKKLITILNRCLEWRADGIYYKPDPRHAEIIIDEMGVGGCSPVVTPRTNMSLLPKEDDPILKPEFATKFRRVVARANCLSQDRMDIQYAVKEATVPWLHQNSRTMKSLCESPSIFLAERDMW